MLSNRKGDIPASLKIKMLAVVLAASLLAMGFLAWRNLSPVPNASAVLASSNIGVYWDSAATRSVTSINWGNVTPGSENYRAVYVKNLGTEPLVLSMNTSTWNPSSASLKIFLCWDYNGKQVGAGSVVKVILKLIVSYSITGINGFSFDIIIGTGLEKSPDLNSDGIVNIFDATVLGLAWLSRAGSPNYNYRCDFNNDGIVNISDAMIFALGWLKTSG